MVETKRNGNHFGIGIICRDRYGDHFGGWDHFRVGIFSGAVVSILNHKRLLLKSSSSYYTKCSTMSTVMQKIIPVFHGQILKDKALQVTFPHLPSSSKAL